MGVEVYEHEGISFRTFESRDKVMGKVKVNYSKILFYLIDF